MNSPDKPAGRAKRYLKSGLILTSLLLAPVLLCVSCHLACFAILDYELEHHKDHVNYYFEYTKPVEKICHDYGFSIADELEFVEGYYYGGWDGSLFYALFRMDEQTYQSKWTDWLTKQNEPIPANDSPSSIRTMKEKYGLEFPSGYSYYPFSEIFVSEMQADNQYYVLFQRET